MKLRFFLRFGLPFKTGALISIISKKIPVCHWRQIVIEEYLIVACNFIGRRLVSPVSCIFMKTRFCQSNCLRYVWGVTGERTVGADDATFNNSQKCYFVAVKTQLFSRNICIITSLADPGGATPTTPPTPNDSGPMILLEFMPQTLNFLNLFPLGSLANHLHNLPSVVSYGGQWHAPWFISSCIVIPQAAEQFEIHQIHVHLKWETSQL